MTIQRSIYFDDDEWSSAAWLLMTVRVPDVGALLFPRCLRSIRWNY